MPPPHTRSISHITVYNMKVSTCFVKGQEVLWKFIWIKMPQQTVKAYLKEWGSMSTMHGIPWLVSARTGKARIFWTVVCILAMMMFIYMLVSLVLKYYQYPVVVKVDQVSSTTSITNLCISIPENATFYFGLFFVVSFFCLFCFVLFCFQHLWNLCCAPLQKYRACSIVHH